MGYEGRSLRLFNTTLQIVGEIGAEWCNAHGTAVAHRALSAEGIRRRIPPLRTGHDFAHLNPGHLAITTFRIALETAGESLRQRVLMHLTVRLENGDD